MKRPEEQKITASKTDLKVALLTANTNSPILDDFARFLVMECAELRQEYDSSDPNINLVTPSEFANMIMFAAMSIKSSLNPDFERHYPRLFKFVETGHCPSNLCARISKVLRDNSKLVEFAQTFDVVSVIYFPHTC